MALLPTRPQGTRQWHLWNNRLTRDCLWDWVRSQSRISASLHPSGPVFFSLLPAQVSAEAGIHLSPFHPTPGGTQAAHLIGLSTLGKQTHTEGGCTFKGIGVFFFFGFCFSLFIEANLSDLKKKKKRQSINEYKSSSVPSLRILHYRKCLITLHLNSSLE